jgi:predicted nucleotidyltransferase
MTYLDLSDVNSHVKGRMEPFFNEILSSFDACINSIYIIGSAVTSDFDEKTTDVDSLIVLQEMVLDIFDFIAPIGKKYGKKRIRAPIIMTNDYIRTSLEVFPIQFLNMKTINKHVYGEDVLKNITIEKSDLRLVCERELKGWIQNLGQAYIKSLGNNRILRELYVSFLSSYIPIFRAVLFLYDRELPQGRNGVLDEFEEVMDIKMNVFRELVKIKTLKYKPSHTDLKKDFHDIYNALDSIAKKVDELEV